MVRTWHFNCYGLGSIPGQGTEIWQAKQKKKPTHPKPRLNSVEGGELTLANVIKENVIKEVVI